MARKYPGFIFAALSYIFGGASLLVFAVFLWWGNFNLVNFGWNQGSALIFNATISLVFFLQHSIMVRRFFSDFISRFITDAYTGAVYSITSGIFLFTVMIFWQSTSVLFEAQGIIRLSLRAVFIMCVIGFFWAVKSVEFFDPFGVRKIKEYLKNEHRRQTALAVKGTYRLVRHPLYLFIIIMIWLCPDLTADRLLFNIMWSVWIIAGATWEEKDLLRQFGDAYRKYQKEVPMLLPLKLPKKENPRSH